MHELNSYKRKVIDKLTSILPKIINNNIYVLHGFNLSTGEAGRDLDIYIRDTTSHDRVIESYWAILSEMGAKWAMIMPPIWGKRCIGVWEKNYSYCELHIISSVRMGPVSGEDVLPRIDANFYNGLYCDPWLYVFKNLLMRNKARILSRKPLWESGDPDEFLCLCVMKCLKASHEQGINLEFLEVFIDKDNEKNIDARRNGLIKFIFSWSIRNPLRFIYNIFTSIISKFALYFFPCVPSFELSGPAHIEDIQKEFSKKLGGVFPRVVISSHKIPFLHRRKMQAMQQLFVYYHQISATSFHLKSSDFPNIECKIVNLDMIFHQIMSMMTQYNMHFNPLPNMGFVTAILGPDGSGKSTVLSKILPRTANLGQETWQFHLWPRGDRQARQRAPVTAPHSLPPRGLASSTLKLLFLAWRYNAGWLAAVFKPYRRSAMIWFDRYYHDMLADPKRYRMGAPAWLVRLVGRLIPKPDLFLILDVRPEVARARKSEVSEAESQRQFHAYRALAKELPNAVLIDANGSSEEVAAACERAVVAAMARRLDKHMRRKSSGWVTP